MFEKSISPLSQGLYLINLVGCDLRYQMTEITLFPASQTSFSKFTIKFKQNIESVNDKLKMIENKGLLPSWSSAT